MTHTDDHIPAQQELHWIESSGGPFVVLSASLLPTWLGSNGDEYEAACEVDDYLGLISVGKAGHIHVGLVIGDEPLTSTYIPDLKCILQWQYAPSENSLVSAARIAIEGSLDWENGPTLKVQDNLVMFDAAASAASLEEREILPISLPPGMYRCLTADFSIEDTSGRLHWFRSASNTGSQVN